MITFENVLVITLAIANAIIWSWAALRIFV
jgi:hypothetical protein